MRLFVFVALAFLNLSNLAQAQQARKSYRLSAVDVKQRILWGEECRQPPGHGLAFGGQGQDADDGRPHTRILVEGKWHPIHKELRANNPLQALHARTQKLRDLTRNLLAKVRYIFFQGHPSNEEKTLLQRELSPMHMGLASSLDELIREVESHRGEVYEREQTQFAKDHLGRARTLLGKLPKALQAEHLSNLHRAQIQLELAAEAFDAEPPARALVCGPPRRASPEEHPSAGMVYDTKTGLYVLFGGDHLDYLTNDTWVFDPAKRTWYQRHPQGAPPPRANHLLKASDGKVSLTGGYTYTSNTDYIGGQYADLDDGTWTYDIAKNEWTGGKLVAADSRTYRSGLFHPDHYFQGDKPDAAKFDAWLAKLPPNRWVKTNPSYRPRLNRDWGCARLDPDRDVLLRWSGGHSAHGGTDVPHFHFATNRWELPFPVEFPLGQLYSNTSYPNGYNFNLRPWMTGHTYQNYAYDPPSKTMVKAGRPRHFYVYDPDKADWIGRGEKSKAMQYNSCFYTLTLTATPHGAVCWDKYGRVHRYDHRKGEWLELELIGDKLPGAYVDNSTIAYDSHRDRLLIFPSKGYRVPYDGQIYSVNLKSNKVEALSPEGSEIGKEFGYIDRCIYDSDQDLVLIASFLKDGGEHTPTPAYDCKTNRWVTLDLSYETRKRGDRVLREFPHGRSCGLVYDVKRKLFWGTDTNSQVFVLRLEREAKKE